MPEHASCPVLSHLGSDPCPSGPRAAVLEQRGGTCPRQDDLAVQLESAQKLAEAAATAAAQKADRQAAQLKALQTEAQRAQQALEEGATDRERAARHLAQEQQVGGGAFDADMHPRWLANDTNSFVRIT